MVAELCGVFPGADFGPLVDSITYSDFYLLANDFPDYIRTQVGVWGGWVCNTACVCAHSGLYAHCFRHVPIQHT